MKHNDLIAEKFGTTYEVAPTPEQSKEIVVPVKKELTVIQSEPQEEKDQVKDYNVSRKTFNDLINKGNEAVDYLFEMAKQSEHPRAFEALSALIKTVSDVTKDLYDLQKKTKELKSDKSSHDTNKMNIEQGVVFVGSTSDLLDKIKKGENI